MHYVICEKCSGYYELKEGESPEDFDRCQCGGNLIYTENLKESSKEDMDENIGENIKKDDTDISEEESDNEEDEWSDELKLICPNCLQKESDGIYCSKCGGKLLTIGEDKIENAVKTERYNKLKNDLKEISPTQEAPEPIEDPKSLFKRINLFGVLAGAGFLLITTFLLWFIVGMIYDNSYNYSFGFLFTVFIIVEFFLIVISGVLTCYFIDSRKYFDGLLNGFLVGAINAVIIGFYWSTTGAGIFGIFLMIITIPLLGVFTALGGLIGIFLTIRLKEMSYLGSI